MALNRAPNSRPLRDIFRARPTAEWITFADEHDTTIAPVNDARSVRDDPQFQNRFALYPVEQLGAEQLPLPIFLDGEELPVPTKAPEVGEHNDEVLRDVLGYDDAQMAALREAGALG